MKFSSISDLNLHSNLILLRSRFTFRGLCNMILTNSISVSIVRMHVSIDDWMRDIHLYGIKIETPKLWVLSFSKTNEEHVINKYIMRRTFSMHETHICNRNFQVRKLLKKLTKKTDWPSIRETGGVEFFMNLLWDGILLLKTRGKEPLLSITQASSNLVHLGSSVYTELFVITKLNKTDALYTMWHQVSTGVNRRQC